MLALALCSVVLSPSVGAQVFTTCAGEEATIVGTNGDDVLVGTPQKDVIVGNAGNDQIFGAAGNDIICGNAGADLIQGGVGRDLLIGGFGDDRIRGGGWADEIRGGPGNDYISGETGDDVLFGEAGADRIAGNFGNDTCMPVQTIDTQITSCEVGNFTQAKGFGDGVGDLSAVPDAHRVARHCFAPGDCDDYFAARIEMNGAGDFDTMSIEAFDAQGNAIATYAGVGDKFNGGFLFKGKPVRIEVDSGGGPWWVTVVNQFGVPLKGATASGTGNEVYRISNANKDFGSISSTWNGFGNYAVTGVSPTRGRDLMVNEVRFAGGDQPPFTANATAQSGISVVSVLSAEGTWSVRLGS